MKRVALLFALVTAVAAGAGCSAPPASFVVESAAHTGADADPGDGICANATGVCSLQAAVEEANSLGGAEIVLKDSEPHHPGDLAITGRVTMRFAEPVGGAEYEAHTRVAEGALLNLDGVGLGPTEVAGALIAVRSSIWERGATADSGPVLTITPTGTALITNMLIRGDSRMVIDNSGQMSLHGTTLLAPPGPLDLDFPPALFTRPGGRTVLGAVSATQQFHRGPVCGGLLPESQGYNVLYDDSCELSGPGDLHNVVEREPLLPAPDSVRLDAIPKGVLGCGEEWDAMINGQPRPLDGDDDGVAACDVGAFESRYVDPWSRRGGASGTARNSHSDLPFLAGLY